MTIRVNHIINKVLFSLFFMSVMEITNNIAKVVYKKIINSLSPIRFGMRTSPSNIYHTKSLNVISQSMIHKYFSMFSLQIYYFTVIVSNPLNKILLLNKPSIWICTFSPFSKIDSTDERLYFTTSLLISLSTFILPAGMTLLMKI